MHDIDEMDEFDRWNRLKKQISLNKKTVRFPHEGEVWMSAMGKNIGSEQNGVSNRFSRPVLILKKFNNQMFWVIPLSTKQKNIDFYFNFTDPDGLRVSAILAQLRLFSVRRLNRKMYQLAPGVLCKITLLIKQLLD